MKKPRFNTSESAIFILILVSVLALPLVMPKIAAFFGTDIPDFGDQYGALNTLFSGLAFFVIYLSLKTQREELRAQREEMAMARGEHERQNFEAQLMFLLKNLGEQLTAVRGDFIKEDGTVDSHEGREYFSQIFNDMHRLHNGLTWANPEVELFKMYNIDLESNEYKEKYEKGHLNDFSSQLMISIEIKRRREYFNVYQTFTLVLDVLRNQFSYQIKQANQNKDRIVEIEHHFDVYTGLVRSTLSVTNLVYFLYVQKRYKDAFKKDFVSDSLFYKLASGDFLDWRQHDQLGYQEVKKRKEAYMNEDVTDN